MGSYDKLNKLKEQQNKLLLEKDAEIASLKAEIAKKDEKIKSLRQELFDAGHGKGEVNRLNRQIVEHKRENKTLENKIKELQGKNITSIFNPERQELIEKIKKLKFNNSIFNSLAYKFKDGLDNILQIAYLIKCNSVNDMDYYTFVFRDNIVGLLEKMLNAVTGKKEDSASKYLVKLSTGEYTMHRKYYNAVPGMKDKTTLTNILYLINLESTGYHGSQTHQKHLVTDKETNETRKYYNFLNLDSKSQLDAIFTLLHFMYFVFTCDDSEQNLILISSCWFKTI